MASSKLKFRHVHIDYLGEGQHNYELVARLQGKVVGAVDYSIVKGEKKVWINLIGVKERYRRRGIGTAMVWELQKQYRFHELVWGYSTPEGEALRKSMENPRMSTCRRKNAMAKKRRRGPYFGYWWGGESYRFSTEPEHLEVFDTLDEAKRVLKSRYWDYGKTGTPAVTLSSEIWLFYEDPTDLDDKYPDLIVKFGPRGGVFVDIG